MTRRARHQVVSFLGAVVRRMDNWMPIAGTVELLSEVDVDSATVRSAVFRLKKREWLVAETRAGARGYALTDLALSELAAGDELIWHSRQPADLRDGWCIVTFSVPESERGVRDQMRNRLTKMGFGNLGAGVWIAPARSLRAAEKAVSEFDLSQQSAILIGEYIAGPQLATLAYSLWNLDDLNREYRDFLARHRAGLAKLRRSNRVSESRAFTTYLRVVDDWRALPFRDPGLPVDLLRDDWASPAATKLFEDTVQLVEAPALEHAARYWPTRV